MCFRRDLGKPRASLAGLKQGQFFSYKQHLRERNHLIVKQEELSFKLSVKTLLDIVSFLVVLTNHIHVSGDEFSHDHKGCGSLQQPCASIQYAINISSNFDTILLNSDYVYHQNKSLVTDKSINITSYNTTIATVKTTIVFNLTDHTNFIIEISNNISMSYLKIQMDSENILLHVKKHDGGVFEMRNCTIDRLGVNIGGYAFNFLYRFQNQLNGDFLYGFIKYSWSLNWISSQFQINQPVTKSIYRQRKSFSETQLSRIDNILFQDCVFIQTALSLDISNKITLIGCKLFSSVIFTSDGPDNLQYLIRAAIHVNVRVQTCLFNFSSIFFDVSTSSMKGNIAINNTIFDGTMVEYPKQASLHNLPQILTGMDSFGLVSVNLTISLCIFQNAAGYSIVATQSNGMVIITNTKFINNTFKFPNKIPNIQSGRPSTFAAAVTIFSGHVQIHNCTFRNNSMPQPQTGSLQVTPNNDDGSFPTFTMTNTVIEAGIQPFTFESTVVTIINYDEEIIYLFTIANVNITCPMNHQEMHNIKNNHGTIFNTFIFKCVRCKFTSYNVKEISGINIDKRSHIIEHNSTICYPCPYQASCINEIRSRGNYWGISNSSGAVTFLICPPSYCCSSLAKCTSYDTCAENRMGRLCGDCANGHSLSLLGHNQCAPSMNCIVKLFWFGYALAVVMICLFVMYNKEVVTFLKSVITKKCRQEHFNTRMVSFSGADNETESQYELLLPDVVAGENSSRKQANISGLFKIAFFFYQTASIIRINASAKSMYNVPPIIDLLTSLFNVKITIQSSNTVNVCPLNTKEKMILEAVRTSLVITCLLLLLLVICVTCCVKKLWKRGKEVSRKSITSESENSNIGDPMNANDSPETSVKIPIMIRLKGAYVQLLLIGYAGIAVFCLQGVNCIFIDGLPCLYLQASVVCYQYWQYMLFVFISTWVVPFPISIYVGCCLLRENEININTFLFIITFPPATLYHLIKSYMRNSTEDRQQMLPQSLQETDHIMSILNEPFQSQDNNNSQNTGYRLIWEPVLIVRRLVLVAVSTFIIPPMEKLYPVAVLLLMFTLHDMFVRPYANKRLNAIQLVSMQLLCLLTFINLFWAFSNDIDISQEQSPQYYQLGKVFLYLEMFILLLPLIILICVVIFKSGKFICKVIARKQD